MSYLYKGQNVRPIDFKHQGKVNKYKDVPRMRIISLEQPDFIEDCYKSTVLLERVGVELKWRSRMTMPVIGVLRAVMNERLALTNPSALDRWSGWSTARVFVDTGERLIRIPRE